MKTGKDKAIEYLNEHSVTVGNIKPIDIITVTDAIKAIEIASKREIYTKEATTPGTPENIIMRLLLKAFQFGRRQRDSENPTYRDWLIENKVIHEIDKALAKKQQEWIKCSDRLPDDISWVLVTPGNFGWYSNYEKRWLTWNDVQIYPTHWQPLPSKPQQ